MKPNVIMNEATDPQGMIENWKEAELLTLANHFHKLEDTNNQYLRVDRFDMSAQDLATFNSLKPKDILRLKIHLGLNGVDKRQITFRPILGVVNQENTEAYRFILEPVIVTTGSGGSNSGQLNSEPVPPPFKEAITENWKRADTNLIDDLFIVQTMTNVSSPNSITLERVIFYTVQGQGLQVIKALIGNIERFSIYPGMDRNKNFKIGETSFTPIIGMEHPTVIGNLGELYGFAIAGNIEFTREETYVEYSAPCPSTCP